MEYMFNSSFDQKDPNKLPKELSEFLFANPQIANKSPVDAITDIAGSVNRSIQNTRARMQDFNSYQ